MKLHELVWGIAALAMLYISGSMVLGGGIAVLAGSNVVLGIMLGAAGGFAVACYQFISPAARLLKRMFNNVSLDFNSKRFILSISDTPVFTAVRAERVIRLDTREIIRALREFERKVEDVNRRRYFDSRMGTAALPPTPPPPPPVKVEPAVAVSTDKILEALRSDPAFERELVAVILANRNRLGK